MKTTIKKITFVITLVLMAISCNYVEKEDIITDEQLYGVKTNPSVDTTTSYNNTPSTKPETVNIKGPDTLRLVAISNATNDTLVRVNEVYYNGVWACDSFSIDTRKKISAYSKETIKHFVEKFTIEINYTYIRNRLDQIRGIDYNYKFKNSTKEFNSIFGIGPMTDTYSTAGQFLKKRYVSSLESPFKNNFNYDGMPFVSACFNISINEFHIYIYAWEKSSASSYFRPIKYVFKRKSTPQQYKLIEKINSSYIFY